MAPPPNNNGESHIDIVDTASSNGNADEAVIPDETMPINAVTVQVCTVPNNIFSMVVSRNLSIKDLKLKISLIGSIEPFYQRLIYNGYLLTSCNKIYDYCPTEKVMKIYMTQRIPGDMQIFMQHFLGYTLVMKLDKSDTIRSVKCILAARDGIPIEEQRIFYEGRQLEDHRTLSDYKITHNSTMRVSLRLRAGA